MDDLKQALKISMANSFVFYMKAHYYHFNVEGPLFLQLHDLFGKIYEDVYDSIDQFGEEIRALGSYTPMSLGRFQEMSMIEEPQGPAPAADMIQQLMKDNQIVHDLLKQTFELSEQAGTYGLSDFIAGRMDAHKKHAWMLRATSKQG